MIGNSAIDKNAKMDHESFVEDKKPVEESKDWMIEQDFKIYKVYNE